MTREEKVEMIARVCHEANRAWCFACGDDSQVPWDEAPGWLKRSCMDGVTGALEGNSPRDSHESWLSARAKAGWTYGPVKDETAKTHPCFVPYHELPIADRAKDKLFVDVVLALRDALGL